MAEDRAISTVAEYLKEKNLMADEAALKLLSEFVIQICNGLISESAVFAKHGSRSEIGPDEVVAALKSYSSRYPSRSERAEMAKAINAQELPKPRTSGLQIPVDRFCMTQPSYATTLTSSDSVRLKSRSRPAEPSEDEPVVKQMRHGSSMIEMHQTANLLKASHEEGYD